MQDVVLCWMKKYSDCVFAFHDIDDAVHVCSANKAIVKVKKILENIPNTANQPLIPQILLQPPIKENGNELKRKQTQKSIVELMEELQRTYQQTELYHPNVFQTFLEL